MAMNLLACDLGRRVTESLNYAVEVCELLGDFATAIRLQACTLFLFTLLVVPPYESFADTAAYHARCTRQVPQNNPLPTLFHACSAVVPALC